MSGSLKIKKDNSKAYVVLPKKIAISATVPPEAGRPGNVLQYTQFGFKLDRI